MKSPQKALTPKSSCAIMDHMSELLLHNTHEVTPVPPMDHLDIEATTAAQALVAETEAFLTTEAAMTAPEQPEMPQADLDLVQLFLLLKGTEAQKVVAGAIAFDLLGKQHGITEFQYGAAKANVFAAQMAEQDRKRFNTEDDEDDEK